MAAWDLPVVLKKIQQFNRDKNKNLKSAYVTNNDLSNASSTNSPVNVIPEHLTSASVKRSYEMGVSRILGSCSNAGGLLTTYPWDEWSRDHMKHRDWYRLRMSDTSLTVNEYGQMHSVCFMHALHEWSNTMQCSISVVLESLYLALNDLGYLHVVEDLARSPRTSSHERRFISNFLQAPNDSNHNILLKWYRDECLSREENSTVKRPRAAALSTFRDGNNGGDFLAAYADKAKKDEEDGNLAKMYTSALVSLPWVLMRCTYASKKVDKEPVVDSRKTKTSSRKVNLKTHPSSLSSASSVASSRKRAWDEFSVTDRESSAGNASVNTGTLPAPFCFDINIDERWKIEFLYIVTHTYVVHFYRQYEKKLPSWEGIDQFLNFFQKKWYTPMLEEIEVQGFSSLQQIVLTFYGMDTLSSYQYTEEKDPYNANAFKVTSCYLLSFGDNFLSTKTPWEPARHYDKPIQLDRYSCEPHDIKCINGLHPRLMLKILRQHGFVNKLSSLLFPKDRLVLNVSDFTTFSPKEETIVELMKSFLSSNVLDNNRCSVSAACARELQDAFYFVPSSFIHQTSQKIKINGYNARSTCKVTDLFFTQLDMLLRLHEYDKACLLCNEISLSSLFSSRAGECWDKLYEEIGKIHNSSHIGGDIFSHTSLCALWDVLHLQPIGMAGIKALECYVEKQIDASIKRGDTTMVVNLQRFLFKFLRIRFGTCTSISSALGIDKWDLLKNSIYDPQQGPNKFNPENLAKDLMRWNVESGVNNGIQYYTSSNNGESSSNRIGVSTISKSDELNFDSQPSDELQTRSPLSHAHAILDKELHSNKPLLYQKLAAENQISLVDSDPVCDLVVAEESEVPSSDSHKIPLHDTRENENSLFGEESKEQHVKSKCLSHESDTEIPFKKDDNTSHQVSVTLCHEENRSTCTGEKSSSSKYSEPNRDDEHSWDADDTEKDEASHETSCDGSELPKEDIIEIDSTDDGGDSDATSEGIEISAASETESSVTETKSYESDYHSECSSDMQLERSGLGNDVIYCPSSSSEMLAHCSNTHSDSEDDSVESVHASVDNVSCTAESSMKDSHEDQQNIKLIEPPEEKEERCVESNVTSGVSDNKCQNSEAWERVKTKINDQVIEDLVSVNPSSPHEGMLHNEAALVTSEEQKTLSVGAELCVLVKDDVCEEMANIDEALPSQNFVHFADVCEVIYNKEAKISLDKEFDIDHSNVPLGRDLIEAKALQQPVLPDSCSCEEGATEKSLSKDIEDLHLVQNTDSTKFEADKTKKHEEKQFELILSDSEEIRDIGTLSVPAENTNQIILFHEAVNAFGEGDMHEKMGTVEESQRSQYYDRVSDVCSVVYDKENEPGDARGSSTHDTIELETSKEHISILPDYRRFEESAVEKSIHNLEFNRNGLPLQGPLAENIDIGLLEDVKAHHAIQSQATSKVERNIVSVNARDIVRPDIGTTKKEKIYQLTEEIINTVNGDNVNEDIEKTLASNQLIQIPDGCDVVCLKEAHIFFDGDVDTSDSKVSFPNLSTNQEAEQKPVAIFPDSLGYDKSAVDKAMSYIELNADFLPLQGPMALSLDSTLRKVVKSYDDAKGQDTAKSEASKIKNYNEEPHETFLGDLQTELELTNIEKILPSTAEINACNEDDVNDEMAIIEKSLPLQQFQSVVGHEAASNIEAKTIDSKEVETGESKALFASNSREAVASQERMPVLTESLCPAERTADKVTYCDQSIEEVASLQGPLPEKVNSILTEDIKANDGFHSQAVTKLEISKVKGDDENEPKESISAHPEISYQKMQGNVGNSSLPVENENYIVPSNTVTEAFQEYGAREKMAIIEKTLCSKRPSQMNKSFDNEDFASNPKESVESQERVPILTESLCLVERAVDKVTNNGQSIEEVASLQGSLAVKVDSILTEDIEANDGFQSLAVTKLETSKVKGDDENEPKESIFAHPEIYREEMQGNVGNDSFLVENENNTVPSSTVTEAFQEHGAHEKMAIIEKTLCSKRPSQMNKSFDSKDVSSNSKESVESQERVPILTESLCLVERAAGKVTYNGQSIEEVASLQESLAVKVDSPITEAIKANDSFHSQAVTKLDTSKIKGEDENERKEPFFAHPEISHEEMQGNVGSGSLPVENENNTVPSSTVTEAFQEYGAPEEMAIIEKTLRVKRPSQMNVSFDGQDVANDSKVFYDCNGIEKDKHLSDLPESIDPRCGFVKRDATDPDDVYQNIVNQPTAAYENTTSINDVNEDIGNSLLGIPEMKAGQTVAETGPLSNEKAVVAREPLLSKLNAESAVVVKPPFRSGTENFVGTIAITEDSKVSSVYDANKRETSPDNESVMKETVDSQEGARVIEDVNGGHKIRKLSPHPTTKTSLSSATKEQPSTNHTEDDSATPIFTDASHLSSVPEKKYISRAIRVTRSNPSGDAILASGDLESFNSSKRKTKSKALPSRARKSARTHPYESESDVSEHSKLDFLENVDMEKEQIMISGEKEMRSRKEKKQEAVTKSELPPLHPKSESVSLATQRVTRLRLARSKESSMECEDSKTVDHLGTSGPERKHLTNMEATQTRPRRAKRQEAEDKSESPCPTEVGSVSLATQRKTRILPPATSAVSEKTYLKKEIETPAAVGTHDVDLRKNEASKPFDLLQTAEVKKVQLNSTGAYLTRSRKKKQTEIIPELPPCGAEAGSVASENAQFPETPIAVDKATSPIPLSDITVDSGTTITEEPLSLASQRGKRARRETNLKLDDSTKMSTETKPSATKYESSAGTRRSTRLDYIMPSGRSSSETPSPSSLQASATVASGRATRSRSGSSTAVTSIDISHKKSASLRSARAKKI